MKKAQAADFPKFEAEILEFWQKAGIFHKSLKQREAGPKFSFYDGPPFANGLPHYGHVVPVTIKDSITRYKTMQGFYVPRRIGWDTHGLPVEYEVEQQLGLSGKQQILDIGIDKFNAACRDSVFRYKQDWEVFFDRIGRWADKDDSYATLDDDYIESVWWVFATLHERGLIYEGFKSMPYCPRCQTPLSNFEVNQNYKDDTVDPSVTVLFKLADEEAYLAAWTTTPWTLPANAALGVKADAAYTKLELDDGRVIIAAEGRTSAMGLGESAVMQISTLSGKDLIGKRYIPLFEPKQDFSQLESEAVWRVQESDAVSMEDGTGILHIAPAYGEEDLSAGQQYGLPLIRSVGADGKMLEGMPRAGEWFKAADAGIIEQLMESGNILASDTLKHTYPFCWRCETPLMYYATPSWFVAVSQISDKLVKNNDQINWTPAHIKQGRFGNWLAEARDWSVSRNRFWGAPIPVWKCQNDHLNVIGSLEQLRKLAINLPAALDLHRPGIDQIQLSCQECGEPATRIEEVLDCWFESGSMPYAQDHFPFENKERFENAFPADFIAEALDQTRGWFYTLHVLAVALFDQPAFKSVVVNGIVLAADGRKLSKRLKNYPPLDKVFDQYGADSLRYLMMSSPVVSGEDIRFGEAGLSDIQRNLLLTLWNTHSFLSTYAEVDGWTPKSKLISPESTHLLDRWLIARIGQATKQITDAADGYDIARATRPLRELVDDISNWYVRRSRRRFWKSQDDSDKQAAYFTLHYALVVSAKLMAPWMPFIADKLWRELTAEMDEAESVHLCDWPKPAEVDYELLAVMEQARGLVTEGLAKRAEAKIKVRQPLGKATLTLKDEWPDGLIALVAEELNVKNIEHTYASEVSIELDLILSEELLMEGLAKELIRQIQVMRKRSGLQVSDRIIVSISAEGKLQQALQLHTETIKAEVLAKEISDGGEEEVNIGGEMAKITIAKA